MRADAVVTGRIATLGGASDAGFGWVEAIAIRRGRVVAAGRRGDVEAAIDGRPRRFDLPPDRVAVPGLTDSHVHLADLALVSARVDLSEAGDLASGLELVRRFVSRTPGGETWIEGDGWDPVRWGRWPTADDLERAAPGRCVALWSHDHHAIWVSHAALRTAGVDELTADPGGGVVHRDDAGGPSGVLHETAAALVLRHIPPPDSARLEAAIERAAGELLTFGLVAAHDPGEVATDVRLEGGFAAYAALDERGALPIRVHVAVRRESLPIARERGLRSGMPLAGRGGRSPNDTRAADDASRARLGWIKLFADGALGSRTARMLAPYEADPGLGEPPGGPTGVWVTDPLELAELVRSAAAAGIAGEVHAIGDAAVRVALDVLSATKGGAVGRAAPGRGAGSAGAAESAGAAVSAPAPTLMSRIEHIQLADPADIPRFARTGIAASVQPVHIRSDAPSAWRLWGEERVRRGAYPYGWIARSGALIPFGSDAPVESVNPWPAIATAVARRGPDWPPGAPELVTAQRISLPRALRAACVDPALVAGEADRGRLIVGHRADFVVIPAEAVDSPVEPGGALDAVRPDLVVVDGVPVFER